MFLLFTISFFRVLSCYEYSCNTSDPNDSIGKFESFRRVLLTKFSDKIKRFLPSPHSELVLGMVLGVDEFSMVPSFKEALIKTGTIHVVVVSGFNISLVFSIFIAILCSPYKVKNIIIAQIGTLLYSVLSGFEPPILRAWVMGSIVSWGKYYGRSTDILYVLFFSGLLLIALTPSILFSLSFQLSFLASLGLISFGKYFDKIIPVNKGILFSDLSSTLSAQVLVWPLISFHFERISIISPIVNMLVLWVVPISTILGFFLLITASILPILCRMISLPLYAFLDIFVRVVVLFSQVSQATISYKISQNGIFLYFSVLLIVIFIVERSRNES